MADNLNRRCLRFSREEIAAVKRLASSQTLFRREIAERTGMPLSRVQHLMRKLGLNYRAKGRAGERNIKHKHLREPVMRYFLTHSIAETMTHFGLTKSELKSIMSVCYQDPKFVHLRKETRRHDSWTSEELVFLARHAGVQPRAWIAKKLKRGTSESVKEALSRAGIGVRYMNGMPWQWAQELFGFEAIDRVIHMKAGPRGKSGHHGKAISRYRLIPWIECEEMLERGETRKLMGSGRHKPGKKHPRIEVSEEVRQAIKAMAMFQRWIHGVQSGRGIRTRIQAALARR